MNERELLEGGAAPVFGLALRLTGDRAQAEALARETLRRARAASGWAGSPWGCSAPAPRRRRPPSRR